jgi:hypothetical protein
VAVAASKRKSGSSPTASRGRRNRATSAATYVDSGKPSVLGDTRRRARLSWFQSGQTCTRVACYSKGG